MLRTLALCAFAFASLSTASAESVDLDQPVPGYPGKTWFDVVSLVVPDLRMEGGNGIGSTVVPLRFVDHVEGEDDPVPEGEFTLYSVDVQPLLAEGRMLTLVSANLGPADGWAVNIEAVGLFDEQMQLLDAVNTGLDQHNALQGAPLRIGRGDEAVLTYSEHVNSNQAYHQYALLMVRGGKLAVIDTFSTLSDRWCGHDRSQLLTATSTDAGEGYWPITATVTDRLLIPPEDVADGCDGSDETPFDRTVAVTYAWSADGYVVDSDALDRLGKANQDRY